MSRPPPRKKQRVLRQTDIRGFLKPRLPTLQHLDFAQHPTVVKMIVTYLPLRSLLHLRLASRALRDHVDHILRGHLVLKPGNHLDGITGPLPTFRHTNADDILGPRRCWCSYCRHHPSKIERDRVRTTLLDARILDLRYMTTHNLRVLKNLLADRCSPVPIVRLWMWCTKPQPGALPISASTLIVFGWAGMWEPTNGYRCERFGLPPWGIRKAVFNLQVSQTKVPFMFHGLFVKRTPPASLEKVVFVFHANWASDDRPSALEPLQAAIPRILQLLTEARQRRPQIIFVNAEAIFPATFPIPSPNTKYPSFSECTSLIEYVTAYYISVRGSEEFMDKVSFMTLDEYRADIGPEMFQVETLG
ncbi:hypothetical protein CspHIS471_0411390 [Cutaneotrichosporon sp. HIS471]|nr:hypothetical protein CspHIS471_0411390 [Cutaneotrichosporon sp. HIS471]